MLGIRDLHCTVYTSAPSKFLFLLELLTQMNEQDLHTKKRDYFHSEIASRLEERQLFWSHGRIFATDELLAGLAHWYSEI